MEVKIDHFGETGLFLASKRNHLEVVQLLMQNGVNMESTNKDGYTIFILACLYGQFDIIRFLVENKELFLSKINK